jgi:hypothetical protein
MKQYDVEMIRDFIEHLRLELRIKHFENVNPGVSINSILVEQLQKYITRWYTAGLLTDTEIAATEFTEEEYKRIMGEFRQANITRCQKALDALDALDDVLYEALKGAANPESLGIRIITRKAIEERQTQNENL